MNPEELIKQLSGTHIIVKAGNGRGQAAETLFETGEARESKEICDLLLRLLEARKKL